VPRKPRNEFDAGVYHVFARGNDRRRIFLDDVDRRLYLRLVGSVTAHRNWHTLAYCLMGNHVHLLVETVVPNLGLGMHRLQGSYAQLFNRRHSRTGHLFERRFKAVPIVSDAQLQMVARYIAVNPVEAGMCDRPEAWPWSSHAAVTGSAVGPRWLDVNRLLEFFGNAGGGAAERYSRLVAERREARDAPGPLEKASGDLLAQPTPLGDWERIHSRSVSSPTRA
jgi:putative transposase